jgi:hypothetical protein
VSRGEELFSDEFFARIRRDAIRRLVVLHLRLLLQESVPFDRIAEEGSDRIKGR